MTWGDPIGTAYDPATTTLMRTAATSVPAAVDGGAASGEIIKSGSGWIEFEAGEISASHIVGLRNSPCDDPMVCPDMDGTLNGLGFSISLNSDNQVYVLENTPSLQVCGPFGSYSAKSGFEWRLRQQRRHRHTFAGG